MRTAYRIADELHEHLADELATECGGRLCPSMPKEWFVNDEHDTTGPGRRLRALSPEYLRAADVPRWPGADGVTADDVLRYYPQAAAAGLVPDLPPLLASHPELADALRAFFAR